ncbi:MAG: MBL fold metallo-hydrolase [Aquincola sp.]|nr:MBL fold metallo-hydrolase [Aquincola sp.]
MDSSLGSDLAVLQRGWLSSNNILLHGHDNDGAVLVDTGYVTHADQTLALVRHALRPGESLSRIVNTHLHSDHCGGNARLKRAFPAAHLVIPPGEANAVARWDEDALTYRATGQRCERFGHDGVLRAGGSFTVGSRTWTAHAAPGHDPHSLILFDAGEGVLISADALWANGFGVVFPELDGQSAFDDVATVLDEIERMAPRLVIPGHGAPFSDAADALARARSRLAAFRADPSKHARHAIKVLVKYHLLEVQHEPLPMLQAWFAATPLVTRVWQRLGRPERTAAAWLDRLMGELMAGGALRLHEGVVHDT